MDVRKVLKKYSIKPSRHQDQIFLADEEMQKKVVDCAELNRKDTVLEIGSGVGNLTEHIYGKVEEVVAVEKDPRLAAVLRHQEFPDVGILEKDIMATDIEKIKFNKVVSNLPYSVSTPFTFRLLRQDWDLSVLIYQKEFAERMVAEPGSMDYSRLSVAMNHYTDAELLMEIPSDRFYPEPETDSAVVKLEKKTVEEKDTRFWETVKGAFQHKRKKVKNALKDASRFLGIDEEKIKDIEEKLPDKRVYQCDATDFEEIVDLIGEI